MPRVLQHKILMESPVKHGFFTRLGGVSQGVLKGLNISRSVGDDERNVLENRRLCKRVLGGDDKDLVFIHQCHTARVLVLDKNNYQDMKVRLEPFDSIVTDMKNIFIGVMTADCCPILFYNKVNQKIGACHAGWRGAVSGIIANTVAAMATTPEEKEGLCAVIGPTISKQSYEVGVDFIEAFHQAHSNISGDIMQERGRVMKNNNAGGIGCRDGLLDVAGCIEQKEGRFYFDLPRYVASCLEDEGISYASLDQDTYTQPDLFYSYRYATHIYPEGKKSCTGRQASIIGLEG